MYLSSTMGLYAITNGGSNIWTFPMTQSLVSSPVVASDGTIYTGDDMGNMYAVNPEGAQKWKISLQAQSRGYSGTPALAANGDLYLAAGGRLFAITPTGSIRWVFDYDDGYAAVASPCIAQDGTIYVGATWRRKFYAINPDGSMKWEINLEADPGESCAIGSDGTLFCGIPELCAISPSGNILWSNNTFYYSGWSPILANDGSVLKSNSEFSLEKWAPGGIKLWTAARGVTAYGFPYTSAAVDAAGSIYYSASNCVFSISDEGSIQWVFVSPYSVQPTPPPRPPTVISPEVGPDGTIYAVFGSSIWGTTLYALQGSGSGPGTSAWPMLHQNLRHTGKVEKPSIGALKKRADASFEIPIAGEIGHSYTLQYTSNFVNWTTVTNFIARTVSMTVTDTSARNASARYYRVTSP